MMKNLRSILKRGCGNLTDFELFKDERNVIRV